MNENLDLWISDSACNGESPSRSGPALFKDATASVLWRAGPSGTTSVVFLTLEDPHARIKGSRDPLGVQPVWAHLGRRVVLNLTTVTTSIRGFTVLLLGRWWCERLVGEGTIREEDVLSTFLRWEQIGGHARFARNGREQGRILGVERVEAFARRRGGKVAIEDGPNGRILSDQKTYGLWGLYSVAARTSGLITDGPVGLTPLVRAHLEEHVVPRIEHVLPDIRRLVVNGGRLNVRPGARVVEALGNVLAEELDEVELEFYGRTVRDATEASVEPHALGRQRRMREILEHHTDLNPDFGREELERLIPAAEANDPRLAVALRRIGTSEALLAPADGLFAHLQSRRGQTLSSVARELADRWGRNLPHLDRVAFHGLQGEVEPTVGPEVWFQMVRVHDSLANGDYEEALGGMLDWNRLVMASRGAAPWVRIGDGGRLDVRYRGQETELPAASDLLALWRNPYFLPSLKSIARQCRELGA